MFDEDGYDIQRLNMKDFKRYKTLREAQYGPFSTQKLISFAKEFPDRIVSLYSIEFPEPQAYLMLQIREGINELDAWIYQLAFNPYLPLEGLEKLVDYAEFYFLSKKFTKIRMLVRFTQRKLVDLLYKRGWRAVDRIAIYEKNDISNLLIDYKTLDRRYRIIDADPNIHFEGVVNVDRSAFRVGHRIPLETLKRHLTNSGSFVCIDTEDNDRVVGYNYNSINTNKVAHFIRLAALDGYKRQGIGSHLLRNALQWFNSIGIEYCYLRSIPESAGAKLYEKFGFYNVTMECTYEKDFNGNSDEKGIECF